MNQAEFLAPLKVRDADGVPLWERKHDEVIRDRERAYAEYAEQHLGVTYERPIGTAEAATTPLYDLLANDRGARKCMDFFTGVDPTLVAFAACYSEPEAAEAMDDGLYRAFAADLPITSSHECGCGLESYADDTDTLWVQWEASVC